eukprot:9499773-Pyramimonas_sp.AAC.1
MDKREPRLAFSANAEDARIASSRVGYRGSCALKVEGIMICTLRTVEQGLASHLIANIVVDVFKTGAYGATQKEQAQHMADELKKWYITQSKEFKSSKLQGALPHERIYKQKTSSEWPKLKAKAATTRPMSRFAKYLAEKRDAGSMRDRRRRFAAYMLVAVYDTIEKRPKRPTSR